MAFLSKQFFEYLGGGLAGAFIGATISNGRFSKSAALAFALCGVLSCEKRHGQIKVASDCVVAFTSGVVNAAIVTSPLIFLSVALPGQ